MACCPCREGQAGAGEDAEDELGLGVPDSPVDVDVVEDQVAQFFWARDRHMHQVVVLAGDVEGGQDPGAPGEDGVEPQDVVPVV